MNRTSSLILHSVTTFLCSILIMNQIIIIHKSNYNAGMLTKLEAFHTSAKISFDNAVTQLDEIQKRLNEMNTSGVRYKQSISDISQ